MRVTLCLIVKDESAFLDGCVDSVRELVDQIVIVDTGSTDGTAERAERIADDFVTDDFAGDFSAARNLALERATHDWVLFLDADERLPRSQHARVRDCVTSAPEDVLGVRLMRYNMFATGGFYTGRELKLFRNRPDVRYRRRINESVADAIRDAGGRVVPGEILLNHFGHCRPVSTRDAKARRYLALMEDQLRNQPGDGIILGYRGLIERTLGNFASALRESARAVEVAPRSPTVWMCRGPVLRSGGDDASALAAYESGAALAPDHAVLHNMIGLQRLAMGDPAGAAAEFRTAGRLDPQLVHVEINLGLVAQAESRWSDAVHHYLAAGQSNDAFWHEDWHGRVQRDPYSAFYNETVLGYAGLGYHLGYCVLRGRATGTLDADLVERAAAALSTPLAAPYGRIAHPPLVDVHT
jgi:tetratricopeptide (TPR) repeat protein